MQCLLESKDEISVFPVLHLLVFLFNTIFSLLFIIFIVNPSLLFIVKTWSLTKNRPFTAWSQKKTLPLTLSLSFTVNVSSFTKSRLCRRLLHCYLCKDLKIYENQTPSQNSEIFSELIIKASKKHSFAVNFEYVC